MLKKERFGLTILNRCLPPIEYRVVARGAINLSGASIGERKETAGRHGKYQLAFKEFLESKGALLDFITSSFSGSVTISTELNVVVNKVDWVLLSFSWSARPHGDSWSEISSAWGKYLSEL